MRSNMLGNVFNEVMVFLHRDFVIVSLSVSAVGKSASTRDLRVHFPLVVSLALFQNRVLNNGLQIVGRPCTL